MVGIGQHDGIIGDWLPPPAIPAPVPFFSSILVDAMESPYPPLQPPPDQGKNEEQFAATAEATETDEKQPTSVSGDDRPSGDELLETRVCCDQKWSSRLGERVAARAGFNAPRLNTERMRSSDPSRMSGFRLPYLTIPSGLSPTSLLESPVFVANTMVQPSPTTGKFQLSVNGDSKSSTSGSVALEIKRDGLVEDGNASFTLETVEESCHSVYSGAMNKHSFCATEGLVQANGAFDELDTCKAHDPISNSFHIQAKFSGSSSEKDMVAGAHMSDQRPSDLVHPSVDNCQVVEQNQRGGVDSTNGDSDGCISNYGCAASEDGYNWRKYGQKQVKDSEYPLSYYKCTHPNCPVKKKVECSQEGHIIEIIYKGAHNHPKPSPNRRSAIGFLNQVNEMSADISENGAAQFRCLDIDPAWSNAHKEGTDAAPEGRNDNPEVTSSVSGGSDHCPQSTSLHVQNATDQFEAGDAVDVSSTLSNDDKHDGGTCGNVSLGYDEGDESESKRRKIEGYGVEQGRASRAIREPRIVVQTTSEVDILYDGYRWRKYGQKVVKGNPNPRSYYKCTHPGCRVRKHVERASHDLKSVITTYEGKHNHDVPAARNSSHVGYCASYVTAQAASVQTHVHRPEEAPQVNDNMNLAKCEGLSPFDSFGISAEPHLVSSSRCFSFGMNQPSLTNLVMNGFSPSQQRLPVFPSSYLGQQRQMMNQGGYSLLRSEPKVEPGVAGVLHMSSGPSVYNQIMGGLPLGNQM